MWGVVVAAIVFFITMFFIGNYMARGMVAHLCEDGVWGFAEYVKFQLINAITMGLYGIFKGIQYRHDNPCAVSQATSVSKLAI